MPILKRWHLGPMLLILALGACEPTLPTRMTHSDITDFIQQRPSPGTTVEIDAFFSGPTAKWFSLPPPVGGQTRLCPIPIWNHILSDQPFLANLSVLNSTRNNLLNEKAPWLIAAVDPIQRTSIGPFPYHARFRGHWGDPRFADCSRSDRIFVVEQVVKTYGQVPPLKTPRFKLPEDYDQWPRHRDPTWGYSLPYPSNWSVRPLKPKGAVAAIAFSSPQHPEYPVIVEVLSQSARQSRYPNLVEAPATLGVFQQGLGFKVEGSQKLSGETLESEMGDERVQIVLFSTPEQTFELRLRYPLGFAASQQLLAQYTAMVSGFELDNPQRNIPLVIQPAMAPSAPPEEP